MVDFDAKHIAQRLCFGISVLATLGAAQAAEFVVLPDSTTLVMLGELRSSDVEVFSDYLSRGIDELVLSSPGGSLQAAWEIGELVEEAGLSVVLPDAADCASACTIVFMHGEQRVMGETSRLGFHLPTLESGSGFEDLCRSVELALAPLIEEHSTSI